MPEGSLLKALKGGGEPDDASDTDPDIDIRAELRQRRKERFAAEKQQEDSGQGRHDLVYGRRGKDTTEHSVLHGAATG